MDVVPDVDVVLGVLVGVVLGAGVLGGAEVGVGRTVTVAAGGAGARRVTVTAGGGGFVVTTTVAGGCGTTCGACASTVHCARNHAAATANGRNTVVQPMTGHPRFVRSTGAASTTGSRSAHAAVCAATGSTVVGSSVTAPARAVRWWARASERAWTARR